MTGHTTSPTPGGEEVPDVPTGGPGRRAAGSRPITEPTRTGAESPLLGALDVGLLLGAALLRRRFTGPSA